MGRSAMPLFISEGPHTQSDGSTSGTIRERSRLLSVALEDTTKAKVNRKTMYHNSFGSGQPRGM
jgi:hypothetical protein